MISHFKYELIDWLYLASPILLLIVLLLVLKAAYAAKAFQPLPETKPGFCWFPKFSVPVPLITDDADSELNERLARYGFRQLRRDDRAIFYSRGSALGELTFSIKIAKVTATAPLPLTNPIQLKVQYGVSFGCAFDTGDLWTFCRELSDLVQAELKNDTSSRVETGNPYQPPQG